MNLFAKSGEGATTVAQHCGDVRRAADAIWAAVHSDLVVLIPGLPDHLPKLLAAAGLLHDLLKANSAFQGMVSEYKSSDRQPVRHEVLAAAFLTGNGPLAEWFAQMVPEASDRWAVVWAVAGHHFKMTDPARTPAFPLFRDKDAAPKVTLHLGHSDVKALLLEVARVFGQTQAPSLSDLSFDTADDEDGSLRDRIDGYVRLASIEWGKHRRDPLVKTIVAVLKALLAAADAAGSALPERNMKPDEWTRKQLGIRLAPANLADVLKKDLGEHHECIRPFQKAVGLSDKRVTIVAAGCGNGKTTAAYLWAQKWASGKKLIFSYPTTGTATAGFVGYLAEHHDLLSDLIHGKAEVDLEAIRQTHGDERQDIAARIDSLRVWDRRVVVCTVDTVLGLFQTQRRGFYSFPAFVAGAFVFDEIHSYDRRMFGGLLRFLKEFPGVPALLMSASIPPDRERLLREVLGDRTGDLIRGDTNLEGHQRYRIESRESEANCWADVEKAFALGKKILWVCNTVRDAVRVSQEARLKLGAAPIIYHSRFRYMDRAGDGQRPGRQREVLAEFAYHTDGDLKGKRVKPGASFVVTTQVCEMSLDISADLLVTAECPLPALVQRLGRLNRYTTGDDPWLALVYPFSGLPYNEDPARVDLDGDCIESMSATRKAVQDLGGKACCQADLADRLKLMTDPEKPETYSAWLDDGWITEPMPVRDGDQSITVIRKVDLPEITTKLGTNRKFWSAAKLAPWTIPMNYHRGLPKFTEEVGPYPVVADAILAYTLEEGGEWVKQ